jgi:hypothetical protein
MFLGNVGFLQEPHGVTSQKTPFFGTLKYYGDPCLKKRRHSDDEHLKQVMSASDFRPF